MIPGAPFFGPNALAFFVQLIAGIAISEALYALGLWHFIYDLTMSLIVAISG